MDAKTVEGIAPVATEEQTTRIARLYYNNLLDEQPHDGDLYLIFEQLFGTAKMLEVEKTINEWYAVEQRNDRYENFTNDASNYGGI